MRDQVLLRRPGAAACSAIFMRSSCSGSSTRTGPWLNDESLVALRPGSAASPGPTTSTLATSVFPTLVFLQHERATEHQSEVDGGQQSSAKNGARPRCSTGTAGAHLVEQGWAITSVSRQRAVEPVQHLLGVKGMPPGAAPQASKTASPMAGMGASRSTPAPPSPEGPVVRGSFEDHAPHGRDVGGGMKVLAEAAVVVAVGSRSWYSNSACGTPIHAPPGSFVAMAGFSACSPTETL